MKDWIFPSVAFLIFLYGMFFVGLYIYQYTNSDNVNTFSGTSTQSTKDSDINTYIKGIAESFK